MDDYYPEGLVEKQRKDDLFWLSIAEGIAQKSKCQKRQVGAVIVDGYGRVVATGYNFHPRNTYKDHVCLRKDIPSGEQMDVGYCCHAERNAITFANFNDMQGATLYLTHAPCGSCACMILQAGIGDLVYYQDRPSPDGIALIDDLVEDHDRIRIRAYNKETGKRVE